jgi:hypothetical protein
MSGTRPLSTNSQLRLSNSSGEEIAPAVVEYENLLACSQELATGSNPEPENSMDIFK